MAPATNSDLKRRVEHALRFDQTRRAPYYFRYSYNDQTEGWRFEDRSDGNVVIRWYFRDPSRRDFELRKELLAPVAGWLATRGFRGDWGHDDRGPYLHIKG